MLSRNAFKNLIWLFSLALVVAGIISLPKLAWRVSLAGLKLEGRLSAFSWPEVFSGMRPRAFGSNLGRLVTGYSTLKRIEEDGPCPALWQTPLGEYWGRLTDDGALEFQSEEQAKGQIYEHGPVRVKPGDVVVDVGSHLGTFTRYALKQGARLVVAFEPDPVTAACFQKTFAQEIGDGRVILVEAALWREAGTLQFNSLPTHSAQGSINEEGSLSVRASTLDQTVKDLGLTGIDFIKLDIEGAERHALAGASETLRKFTPKIAVCIYHLPDDAEVLPSLVLKIEPSYEMTRTRLQAFFYAPGTM